MLSRHTSVASSEVIDLSSDTDSDECAIIGSWKSQSTLTASGAFLSSLNLDGHSTNDASAVGAAQQSATRQISMSHGKGTSFRDAYAGNPSTSLLSLLDEQSLEVMPYHPSTPSTLAASNDSTPQKRPVVSILPSDDEMGHSPPKKRRAASERAVASTSTTVSRHCTLGISPAAETREVDHQTANENTATSTAQSHQSGMSS